MDNKSSGEKITSAIEQASTHSKGFKLFCSCDKANAIKYFCECEWGCTCSPQHASRCMCLIYKDEYYKCEYASLKVRPDKEGLYFIVFSYYKEGSFIHKYRKITYNQLRKLFSYSLNNRHDAFVLHEWLRNFGIHQGYVSPDLHILTETITKHDRDKPRMRPEGSNTSAPAQFGNALFPTKKRKNNE